MAVSFTSNIGLAKPDDSELAKNWIEWSQLQDDNNSLIENESNLPVTFYSPVITASTTAPNLGTGTARGEYQEFMGMVTGNFIIEFLDPGIAVGSGDYAIRLPFPVDNSFHTVGTSLNATPGAFSVVGEGYIYDNSNGQVSGHLALDVVTVAGVSYVRMATEIYTVVAKTTRLVGATSPTSVANGDTFTGNFFYKRL